MRPVFFILVFLWGVIPPVWAGEVKVAVASNFLGTLKEIATQFEKKTDHQVSIISGSTGKLYAQIKNGAPFELFLAADSHRPALLAKEGFAVPESVWTYATGRITLWSPDPDKINGDGTKIFQTQKFKYLAIANPKTAPYGRAAQQILRKIGVWNQVQGRMVQGENIGQTFQFVATGNADLGFVSLSQVLDPANKIRGKRWDVPEEFYDPLSQDLVLLKEGASNPAAIAFKKFLQSEVARAIIERYGYSFE